MSTDDSSRTRKSTLPLHSLVAEARQRRSTLETFNDELSVLERPLEGDVEYVDEPKPSRWRPIGFAAVVVMVGVGGALFVSRHRASAEAQAKAAEATLAPVVAAAPSPVFAAQAPAAAAAPAEAPAPTEATAPAAAAPEADEAADDDAAASDDSARRAPMSKGAWAKVRSKAGHAKPARATSGKSTTYRRTTTTTTRHTVVAKRVTRHR
jgi:hypothetical protein